MNSELRKARNRAEQAYQDAATASYKNMAGHVPVPYTFRKWSGSIRQMFEDQWGAAERHCDGGWNWVEAHTKYHREPKTVLVALVTDERLAALGLILASRSRVLFRLLEGDPREDCPLRGVRALLMLDFAVTYAQRLGCKEIHLEPVNDDLAVLYRDAYGFEDGKDSKGQPILKRSVT